MPCYKFIIEYDGGPFVGWQRQKNAPSVQQTIEDLFPKFIKQAEVNLFVAGRTDAGVHAHAQVAHAHIETDMEPWKIQNALNAYLVPNPIAILKVEIVPANFHARFSALSRTYKYRIINRKSPLSLLKNRAWHVPQKLNLLAMKEASPHLLGQHDFSAFRTVHCQARNPVRTLTSLNIYSDGEEIFFEVTAPSFLHHQVRNMVGTLVEIGKGRWEPLHIKTILDSRDRAVAGPTAPAHGLYLNQIIYS